MTMFIHQTRLILLALAVCVAAVGSGQAQTLSGRIAGTVTDATGAVVPGATVTITDEATQQTRTVTTESNGFYVVTNLQPGSFAVSAELQGFKKASKTGYTLVADGRLTVDFKLETGNVNETVEITNSAGETVNSTSGEVARVIDGQQVLDLALNGRNYMQLTTLIPGSPLLNDNQLELMTSLSVSQPINGNRGNANSLAVDGGFNLDSGSNGSQINNVGINFIKEVNIKTSNFSAEYGRNSGAAINVVTKSGTSQYHGDAWEFLRNEKLDANNFFINRTALSAAQIAQGVTKQPRAPLRYNNFGWDFGGPVIKKKFFFFAGMEWKLIRRSTTAATRTLPTQAERAGDFGFRLRGADGVIGTADDGVLRDPLQAATTCVGPTIAGGVVTVQAIRTGCFANNRIPTARLTADGRAIANVFTAMEKQALSYSDTATANNAIYQLSNPFEVRQEFIRLDYKINDKHNVYGRFLHDNYVLTDPYGVFIGSQLPTIPTERRRPGYSYQLSHTWLARPNLINEAKANAAWNGQRIPPVGESWKRSTYGFQYTQLYPFGTFEEGIPNVNVNGFATFQGPRGSLLSPTVDIAFSDNLTWIRGAHTVKGGMLIVRNRKDQNGRPEYTGGVVFQTAGNPNTTNQPLADALLGNFRTYTEAENDPVGFFRFTQFEAFALDSWKVNRKLSIEYGVRYQYGLPTYTQQNNMANFDPSRYNPAQAVTVLANGLLDTTKGGNRFNGLVRAGDGVPKEQLGRVPFGDSARVLSVPTGAERGLYKAQHLFGPRVSFAFAPFDDNRTAIRGGFGVFFDRPEGNLWFSAVNLPPYLDSSQFENGNLSAIAGGRAGALAPFGGIPAINPGLVTPRTMNFSLSVQRELPLGIFFESSYVGNLGRHLLRQPDINQPTFAALVANAALPTAQRLSVNSLRPYKGFSNINMYLSDANSNYHSLQMYATKRKGNVNFTVSYTWSKALADTVGGGNADGNPVGEDPFDRRINYGPVSFDRRHILVGTFMYRVPGFKKSNGFLRNVLGGWEASGIPRWQTGQYLTVSSNSSIGGRRADYVGGQDISLGGDAVFTRWFNTAAFVQTPDTRRGTSGVGMVKGPGRFLTDLSLRKRFALTERFKLLFQGDMFNVFNQTQFNNPDTNFNSLAFGTINGAAPGRNAQLGLTLTF